MLDEPLVTPQETLPRNIAGSGPRPKPIFAVQANFITDGLILAFVTQNQTMDLAGQRQIMSLLSRVSRRYTQRLTIRRCQPDSPPS
jgi:hypothetical protein